MLNAHLHITPFISHISHMLFPGISRSCSGNNPAFIVCILIVVKAQLLLEHIILCLGPSVDKPLKIRQSHLARFLLSDRIERSF
jgi:hypothetical protein